MSKKGFTLLEILVVLMVLGFLTAMVAGHFSHIKGEAAIVTALNEMKDIKEVIRDRFYPDLGLIPEDLGPDDVRGSGDERPEFAIKLLCLIDDGGNERADMLVFLTTCGNPSLIDWDKYSRKGWKGPYLEREITAYDDKGTPNPADDEWYPLIIDSWGESVETSVDPDKVTGEYRIIYDELDGSPGLTREDERLSARIVSFGADGEEASSFTGTDGNTYVCIKTHTADASNCPVTGINYKEYWVLDNAYTSVGAWAASTRYRQGDDLVMFIFGTQPMRRP